MSPGPVPQARRRACRGHGGGGCSGIDGQTTEPQRAPRHPSDSSSRLRGGCHARAPILWGSLVRRDGCYSCHPLCRLRGAHQVPAFRMEGEHLYNYESGAFDDFEAEANQSGVPADDAPQVGQDLDVLRVREYEKNRGLYLVHNWRRSRKPGEVADIVIRLREHRESSTRPSLLAEGKVERVGYELGRMFFKEPAVKRNKDDGFALEVSANDRCSAGPRSSSTTDTLRSI